MKVNGVNFDKPNRKNNSGFINSNRAVRLMGLFFLFISKMSLAQLSDTPPNTITPYEITISYHQTTNLIFPYAIKSVDRGSGAVIVQKAKGVENILQVKASKKGFEPTNLSVVTAEGRFYSFVVFYGAEPSELNISFAGTDWVQLAGEGANAQQLEKQSWKVRGMLRFMGLQRRDQEMQLQLAGIWLSENTMWYKLRVHNRSQIGFRTDYVRFFLRDRKRSKRTAVQETEVFPIYSATSERVNGLEQAQWVVGFQPLTVPPDKKLIIQVGEKNNGRTIVLPVRSKLVLRARKLPG